MTACFLLWTVKPFQQRTTLYDLTLLHSEQPKLHTFAFRTAKLHTTALRTAESLLQNSQNYTLLHSKQPKPHPSALRTAKTTPYHTQNGQHSTLRTAKKYTYCIQNSQNYTLLHSEQPKPLPLTLKMTIILHTEQPATTPYCTKNSQKYTLLH